MNCPRCGESSLWDAAWGRCWVCDYGKQEPMPTWQKILLFIPAMIVFGLE